jgi:hypothetical protein
MKLDKIIEIVRNLNENMTVGGGNVAGLEPDQPPVYLDNKKKRPPIIARGLMPGARKRWMK